MNNTEKMQEADSKFDNKDKPMFIDKEPNTINYFLPGPNVDNDKRVSVEITQQLQRDFKHVFTGIGYFDGTFSFQAKPDSKPYQVPPRCVDYALQKPFKEELEWLQQQDIMTPLGMDETVEWCNSFVIVHKLNGKVGLCLYPSRLNEALIRLVHRGLTLNHILPKLNNAQYLSLIDASYRWYTMKNTTDMQTGKSKTKQRQNYFRCTSVPFLGEVISRLVWNQTHKSWKHLWR